MLIYFVGILLSLPLAATLPGPTEPLRKDLLQALVPDTTLASATDLYSAWDIHRSFRYRRDLLSKFFEGEITIDAFPKRAPLPIQTGFPETIDLSAIRVDASVVFLPQREPARIGAHTTCAPYRVVISSKGQSVPLFIADNRLTPGQTKDPAVVDICLTDLAIDVTPIPVQAATPSITILDALSTGVRNRNPGDKHILFSSIVLRGADKDLRRSLKQAGYDPETQYLFSLKPEGHPASAPLDGLPHNRLEEAYTASPHAIRRVLVSLARSIQSSLRFSEEELTQRIANGETLGERMDITDLPFFNFTITYGATPVTLPFATHIEIGSEPNPPVSSTVRNRILTEISKQLTFLTTDGYPIQVRWTDLNQITLPAFFALMEKVRLKIPDPDRNTASIDFRQRTIRVSAPLNVFPLFVEKTYANRAAPPGKFRSVLMLDGQEIAYSETDILNVYSCCDLRYNLRVEHPFYEAVERPITPADLNRGRINIAFGNPLQVEHRMQIRVSGHSVRDRLPRVIRYHGALLPLQSESAGLLSATIRAPVEAGESPIALQPEDEAEWSLVNTNARVEQNGRGSSVRILHQADLIRKTAVRPFAVQLSSREPADRIIEVEFEFEPPPECTVVDKPTDISLPAGKLSEKWEVRLVCAVQNESVHPPVQLVFKKPYGFNIVGWGEDRMSNWQESLYTARTTSSESLRLELIPLPPLEVFFVEIANQVLDREGMYDAILERITPDSKVFLYVSNGASFNSGDQTTARQVLASMFKMDAWGTNVFEELSRMVRLLSKTNAELTRLNLNIHLLLSTESYYTLSEEPEERVPTILEGLGSYEPNVFVYVHASARQKQVLLNPFSVSFCSDGEPIRLLPNGRSFAGP